MTHNDSRRPHDRTAAMEQTHSASRRENWIVTRSVSTDHHRPNRRPGRGRIRRRRARCARAATQPAARRRAPVRRKLCATPGYFEKHGVPRIPQDLGHHNCLDYTHSGEQGLWRFMGPEGDIAVPVSGLLRINDDEAPSQAVLGGLGLALLPTFIIGADIQAGRLRAALSEYISVEQHVYALYLPTRYLPAKVRAFVDFLLERFSPDSHWDRD